VDRHLLKERERMGSFFYDSKDDALRVRVKPRNGQYPEWLTYEFPSRKPAEATVEMQ
jgi:hypothetical protein